MPKCDNCDSFLSERFKAVFGDNQDNVYSCPECSSRVERSRIL